MRFSTPLLIVFTGYHQSCDLDVDLLLAAMPRTIANAVRSQLWGCLAPSISSISGGHDSGRKRAKKRQRLLIELVADQGRETLLRWSDGSEEALQVWNLMSNLVCALLCSHMCES